QAETMESYFELVVDRLTAAGYRWYETANFCRESDRDLRSRHNLAYWLGRDYLGIGVGAVSTIDGRRWRNTPRLAMYMRSLETGSRPEREVEPPDSSHGAPTRATRARGGGVRCERPTGRLQTPRRARGTARVTVDRPQRAGGAREPRVADASAHLGGPRPDRAGLQGVRSGA